MLSELTRAGLSPSAFAFLSQVETDLNVAGVCVDIQMAPTIVYPNGQGMLVSGYFVDRPELAFGAALSGPESRWLALLAHEYNHFCQWRENSEHWQNVFVNNAEAVDYLDAWVNGTEFSSSAIQDFVRRAQNVEWDCERRTLNSIEQYELPVDPKVYAQKANAYVGLYTFVGRHRRWTPPGHAPYDRDDVWRQMPSVLCSPEELDDPAVQSIFDQVYARVDATGPKF